MSLVGAALIAKLRSVAVSLCLDDEALSQVAALSGSPRLMVNG